MANFSQLPSDRLSASLGQGIVGVHFEKGVPVLDRDLNLFSDLLVHGSQRVLKSYVGDGVPAENSGFAVSVPPTGGVTNDFVIMPGTCLVAGVEVENPTALLYSAQVPSPPALSPALPSPDGSLERHDLIYLDTWIDEVSGADDDALMSWDDVGMQTSVRRKLTWAVRVVEGNPLPAAPAGHAYLPLAQLVRARQDPPITTVAPDMIHDLRVTQLTLADANRSLKNLQSTHVPWLDGAFVRNDFVQPIKMPILERDVLNSNQIVIELIGGDFGLYADSVPVDHVDAFIDGIPVQITRAPAAIPGRLNRIAIPPNLGVGWHEIVVPLPVPWAAPLKTKVYLREEWARYPGFANDIGVGPNGTACVIGSVDGGMPQGGYQVLTWGGIGWYQFYPKYAQRVAVGPVNPSYPGIGGIPWVADLRYGSSRLISYFNLSADYYWAFVSEEAYDIAVGANGTVWKVGTVSVTGDDYTISRYDTGTNSWIVAAGEGGVRLAVDANGEPWVITANNEIRWYHQGQWYDVPGEARDIGIGGTPPSGAAGTVWIISNTPAPGGYVAMKLSDENPLPSTLTQLTWIPCEGAGVSISVGPDGQPWIIDSTQVLRQRVRW